MGSCVHEVVLASRSWRTECFAGCLIELSCLLLRGCPAQPQRHLCSSFQTFFQGAEAILRVTSAARKELNIVDKGQAGHSERWMDSGLDVKELLRKGSSNMIKILPCPRLGWEWLFSFWLGILCHRAQELEIGTLSLYQEAHQRDGVLMCFARDQKGTYGDFLYELRMGCKLDGFVTKGSWVGVLGLPFTYCP